MTRTSPVERTTCERSFFEGTSLASSQALVGDRDAVHACARKFKSPEGCKSPAADDKGIFRVDEGVAVPQTCKRMSIYRGEKNLNRAA
jgi:hypothetical protein